jgi:hypothetical protein
VHSIEQTFYYDEQGLQRRVDYAPQLMNNGPVAHQTEAHRTVSGLVFPTHRCVLPVRDGRVVAKPVITIDFSDIVIEGDRG